MKINTFNFSGNDITTFLDDKKEIWFVAAHVARVLKYSHTGSMIKNHCHKKGVSEQHTLTGGGRQVVKIINEANLYRVIFGSKLKSAEKFQDWVFEDVLPSLRKTGKYSIPEKIIKDSKKTRNTMTDAWQECGVNKPHEFIQLTLQEYKSLGFENWKRKKDFDKGQILALQALESMEQLKLFYEPKNGYYECKDSLQKTAKLLPKKNKELLNKGE